MMALKQDLNLTRDDRRAFIILMRGLGYQLKEIAATIGSSTSQVSYDLKLIRAEAEEDGIAVEVGESAERIRATKIEAEFDRINKARAEADAEMDELCEATGLNTGTLDKWFSGLGTIAHLSERTLDTPSVLEGLHEPDQDPPVLMDHAFLVDAGFPRHTIASVKDPQEEE